MFDRRGGKMLFFQPLRKQLIAVYAGKAHGQHAAAVQVSAERDMSLAAQLQEMLDMPPDVLERHGTIVLQKCAVEVEPCRAADLAQRFELLVGQISHMPANGAGIGVTCDKRLFRDIAQIPEGFF